MNVSKISKFLNVLGEFCDKDAEPSGANTSMGNIVRSVAADLENGKGKTALKYIISDFGEFFTGETRMRTEYDEFFVSRGSMSVTEFLLIYKGGIKKIVRRNKIRNEDEAIAVNGLLANFDTELSDQERKQLSSILNAYFENKT